jgi:hypothetical protein
MTAHCGGENISQNRAAPRQIYMRELLDKKVMLTVPREVSLTVGGSVRS